MIGGHSEVKSDEVICAPRLTQDKITRVEESESEHGVEMGNQIREMGHIYVSANVSKA